MCVESEAYSRRDPEAHASDQFMFKYVFIHANAGTPAHLEHRTHTNTHRGQYQLRCSHFTHIYIHTHSKFINPLVCLCVIHSGTEFSQSSVDYQQVRGTCVCDRKINRTNWKQVESILSRLTATAATANFR